MTPTTSTSAMAENATRGMRRSCTRGFVEPNPAGRSPVRIGSSTSQNDSAARPTERVTTVASRARPSSPQYSERKTCVGHDQR